MQDLLDEDAFDVDKVDYSGIDDGFDSGSKFLSSPVTCFAKRQEDGSMGGSSATFSDRIVGDSPKAADVAPLPAVVAPMSVNVTPPMPTIVGPQAPTASAPPETGSLAFDSIQNVVSTTLVTSLLQCLSAFS